MIADIPTERTLLPDRSWMDQGRSIGSPVYRSGWRTLIDGMLDEIATVVEGSDAVLVVRQMKEKLGLLRVYYRVEGATPARENAISAIVRASEDRSAGICMRCGGVGRLRHLSGPMVVLCDQHEAAELTRTMVEDADAYTLWRAQADDGVVYFFMTSRDDEAMIYFVRCEAANLDPLAGATQVSVWRDRMAPEDKGVTSRVFAVLLAEFPTLISDDQSDNADFWIRQMAEAASRNLGVGLYDGSTEAMEWWTGDQPFRGWIKADMSPGQEVRFVIARRAVPATAQPEDLDG